MSLSSGQFSTLLRYKLSCSIDEQSSRLRIDAAYRVRANVLILLGPTRSCDWHESKKVSIALINL